MKKGNVTIITDRKYEIYENIFKFIKNETNRKDLIKFNGWTIRIVNTYGDNMRGVMNEIIYIDKQLDNEFIENIIKPSTKLSNRISAIRYIPNKILDINLNELLNDNYSKLLCKTDLI